MTGERERLAHALGEMGQDPGSIGRLLGCALTDSSAHSRGCIGAGSLRTEVLSDSPCCSPEQRTQKMLYLSISSHTALQPSQLGFKEPQGSPSEGHPCKSRLPFFSTVPQRPRRKGHGARPTWLRGKDPYSWWLFL